MVSYMVSQQVLDKNLKNLKIRERLFTFSQSANLASIWRILISGGPIKF